MTNIWCLGNLNQYLISNTAVATSSDGQNWNQISNPFINADAGSTICFHDSSLVALSYKGNVSWSNNFSTWTKKGNVGVTNISITGAISANNIIACAQRHYTTAQDGYAEHTDVAQIFISPSGEPDAWSMVYSSNYTPSSFLAIRYFSNVDIGNNVTTDVCVVVGEKSTFPYALYSLDFGQSWVEIVIDSDLTNPFYDVEYNPNEKKWYFATGGLIAIADNLINPTWSSSQLLSNKTIAVGKIKLNPQGEMVALNGNTLWTSQNLENWVPFTAEGYQFKSVEWFDSKWVVGAESLLTQYTFWISNDGNTWIADNNQIQMLSLSIQS